MSRRTKSTEPNSNYSKSYVTHLNNRAVSQWIGVRHTQLNHV
jgi:hypothetical protein